MRETESCVDQDLDLPLHAEVLNRADYFDILTMLTWRRMLIMLMYLRTGWYAVYHMYQCMYTSTMGASRGGTLLDRRRLQHGGSPCESVALYKYIHILGRTTPDTCNITLLTSTDSTTQPPVAIRRSVAAG